MIEPLLAQIHQVAAELPPVMLKRLTGTISHFGSSPTDVATLQQVLSYFPNANFRRLVSDLLKSWSKVSPSTNGEAIVLALDAAAYAVTQSRLALSAEVVWTGPDVPSNPTRRTEQVLLQLIQNTEQHLTIVSFAVYKVSDIANALIAAMNRGVQVKIIAETPEAGESKVPFGVSAGLGREVADRAQVLVWDRKKRLRDSEGRSGSLHMKCAISDDQHLFISSANLTEYALTLNMEMGLLVHSQELATQVTEHIEYLIQKEILVQHGRAS